MCGKLIIGVGFKQTELIFCTDEVFAFLVHSASLLMDMSEDKELRQFLSGIEAFSEVSPETMDKLAAAFSERVCHPGEVVICQGARSSELFLVLDGELAVTIAEEFPAAAKAAITREINRISGDTDWMRYAAQDPDF